MARGRRAGHLTKAEVEKRLRESAPDSMSDDVPSMMELLVCARERGLVTDQEFEMSWPTDVTTLKCYLASLTDDPSLRERLDAYVQAYSLLYRRGTLIANRMADRACAGYPVDDLWTEESVAKASSTDAPFAPLTSMLLRSNSLELKQAFLPERWHVDKLALGVAAVMSNEAVYFEHLKPDGWLAMMGGRVTGWDNALNRMCSKFAVNVDVDVRYHIVQRAIKHARMRHGIHKRTTEAILTKTLRSWRVWSDVSGDAMEELVAMRRVVSGKPAVDLTCVVEVPTVITPELFALHRHVLHHIEPRHPLLPVANLGRKFAYLDDKIAHHLELEGVHSKKRNRVDQPPRTWRDALAIEPAAFNARRTEARRRIRRCLRRRAKGRNARARNRRRAAAARRRCSRRGCGRMPTDAKVSSIETDGVSVVIAMKRPRRVKKVDDGGDAGQEDSSYAPTQQPGFVGIDLGVAKPIVAACLPPDHPDQKPRSVVLTRGSYYRRIYHDPRRRWEQARRMRNEPLHSALTAIADSASETFETRMLVEASHVNALVDEFVREKGRAAWAMRAYTGKRSCLDSTAEAVLRAAMASGSSQEIVVGVGNAKFAPGGRGQKSAPVAATSAAIQRRADSWSKAGNFKVELLSIDEWRTTMCCSACGAVTEAALLNQPTEAGRNRSRRLRQCTRCTLETGIDAIRDRDVQGARNMMELARRAWLGIPRPAHLTRPSRQQIRSTTTAGACLH